MYLQAPFDCSCKSPLCRGRVTGEDWQQPDLIAIYQDYFSVYIAAKLRATAAAAATTTDATEAAPPKSPNSTVTGLQYVENIGQEVTETSNNFRNTSDEVKAEFTDKQWSLTYTLQKVQQNGMHACILNSLLLH